MEIISLTGLILMTSVAILAFIIGYLVSGGRKDNKRLEQELAASKEELKNYRSEVTSHFQLTAHKVNALTENCRNVYEHLARGAQELCDNNGAPLMNELNRKPMLGDETLAKPESVSAAADTGNDSGPKAGPEKSHESPDNTTDTHAVDDQDITTAADADQESHSNEDSDADKNSDRDRAADAAGIR